MVPVLMFFSSTVLVGLPSNFLPLELSLKYTTADGTITLVFINTYLSIIVVTNQFFDNSVSFEF